VLSVSLPKQPTHSCSKGRSKKRMRPKGQLKKPNEPNEPPKGKTNEPPKGKRTALPRHKFNGGSISTPCQLTTAFLKAQRPWLLAVSRESHRYVLSLVTSNDLPAAIESTYPLRTCPPRASESLVSGCPLRHLKRVCGLPLLQRIGNQNGLGVHCGT
jgi:hypothetical protein